jgi:hypothetical protein
MWGRKDEFRPPSSANAAARRLSSGEEQSYTPPAPGSAGRNRRRGRVMKDAHQGRDLQPGRLYVDGEIEARSSSRSTASPSARMARRIRDQGAQAVVMGRSTATWKPGQDCHS